MRRLDVSIGCKAVVLSLAVVGCGGSDDEAARDFDRGKKVGSGTNLVAPGGGVVPLYPAPPYGTTPSSVVENFAFLGWKAPQAVNFEETAFTRVSLADFYDPDGTKGIKLIILNGSAVWCGVCNYEADEINRFQKYAEYKARGVEFVWSLFEDARGAPATPADLAAWASYYEVDFPMVLDPSLKLGAFFNADATPLNLLIDARTMRIIDKLLGYNPNSHWETIDRYLAKL
jgi:hypothetical protein